MTSTEARDTFEHGSQAVENLNYALQITNTFDEARDQLDLVSDTLYELNDIVKTFESLRRIIEAQRFKVRVGDLFVNDCTIDSSPVLTLGTLGHVFDYAEAKRIATIVTRYLKQTATLQPFDGP